MPPSYDEMHDASGQVRPHYEAFDAWLQATSFDEVAHKRRQAETSFHRVGITFSVYGEESGNERLIPFDIVPRIVPSAEWKMLEAGLRQRVQALNLFIDDLYHDQRIIADAQRATAQAYSTQLADQRNIAEAANTQAVFERDQAETARAERCKLLHRNGFVRKKIGEHNVKDGALCVHHTAGQSADGNTGIGVR